MWYVYRVRVKTSVTLPEQLLQQIDQEDSNRSGFLEKAARQYLAQIARAKREARDEQILNAHLESINKDALDTSEYQDLWK